MSNVCLCDLDYSDIYQSTLMLQKRPGQSHYKGVQILKTCAGGSVAAFC